AEEPRFNRPRSEPGTRRFRAWPGRRRRSAGGGKNSMTRMFRACLAILLLGLPAMICVGEVSARADEPDAGRETPATVDERAPVPVPEPSEKAMAFYRSGMWIWGFNRLWAIALPAALVFTGFSARL